MVDHSCRCLSPLMPRVAEGLAVGDVHLVDAVDDLFEVVDILVSRLDVLQEALRRHPVFPESVAT